MKDLIIIGAGGFGREVLSYALDVQRSRMCDWRVKGFINDIEDALDNFDIDFQILGPIKGHKILPNTVYICAIGDSVSRLKVGREFLEKGAEFINLISPDIYLRERFKMGVGNILCPGAGFGPDVTLGNFTLVNAGVAIGHDSIIEDGVTIGSASQIAGRCEINEGVYIGIGAIIIPKRKIGEYANISAGAVVFTNVKADTTVIGNPAKILK